VVGDEWVVMHGSNPFSGAVHLPFSAAVWGGWWSHLLRVPPATGTRALTRPGLADRLRSQTTSNAQHSARSRHSYRRHSLECRLTPTVPRTGRPGITPAA
jgi:hypothetical protein